MNADIPKEATADANSHKAETPKKYETKTRPVVIQNEVNNTVYNERQDPCDCTKLYGKELKDCMAYLENKDFKRNFCKLNPRARLKYIMSLTPDEYYEFSRQLNEESWAECRNNEHPVDQEHFPKTIEEQKRLIRDFHYNTCCWSFFDRLFLCANKSATSDDLGYWRSQCNKGCPDSGGTYSEERVKYAQEKYEREKKEMYRM